jgi:hypothetical protein
MQLRHCTLQREFFDALSLLHPAGRSTFFFAFFFFSQASRRWPARRGSLPHRTTNSQRRVWVESQARNPPKRRSWQHTAW